MFILGMKIQTFSVEFCKSKMRFLESFSNNTVDLENMSAWKINVKKLRQLMASTKVEVPLYICFLF